MNNDENKKKPQSLDPDVVGETIGPDDTRPLTAKEREWIAARKRLEHLRKTMRHGRLRGRGR